MLKHLLAIALLLTPLVHAGEVAFTISGEVKTPLKLTLAEVEAMPAQTISVKDHDGTTASYEGVPLEDILIRADVPHGDSLRGDALRLCEGVHPSSSSRTGRNPPDRSPDCPNPQRVADGEALKSCGAPWHDATLRGRTSAWHKTTRTP